MATVFRVLAAALLVFHALTVAATAGEYRLGVQDKVRVKILEWRDSVGEFFEWTPIDGEYQVNSSGNVSLPMLGEVSALGLRTEELAEAISTSLQGKVGLVARPGASVEVIEYRPFYIVGLVNTPGEYAYRPGMTVLQAVGVAGGLYRPTDTSGRFQREAITARGTLLTTKLELDGLLASRARLRAELSGSDAINFPPQLLERANDPFIAGLMREERLIFETRRDGMRRQMEAFARLKALLHDEIESRQAKIKTEDSQLALIRKEMAGVQQLVDKGLARTPRMLDLKRQLADIQGQRLDYETAVLEARQQVNNTERMMTELQDKRREEIALEHRLAEERLTTLQRKLMTSERLLFEAEVIAPRNQDNHRDLKENYEPTYSIVRPSADGPEVTEATEASMIQPGDTIKVEVPSLAEEYNPKVAGRPVSN